MSKGNAVEDLLNENEQPLEFNPVESTFELKIYDSKEKLGGVVNALSSEQEKGPTNLEQSKKEIPQEEEILPPPLLESTFELRIDDLQNSIIKCGVSLSAEQFSELTKKLQDSNISADEKLKIVTEILENNKETLTKPVDLILLTASQMLALNTPTPTPSEEELGGVVNALSQQQSDVSLAGENSASDKPSDQASSAKSWGCEVM